jgi:hypothetical protein
VDKPVEKTMLFGLSRSKDEKDNLSVNLPMQCHCFRLDRKQEPLSAYGIYTLGDDNFFAGIVASINALRSYGYAGSIAVIDLGFEDWMRNYLATFDGVIVLSIEPVKKGIRFTDVRSDESPVMKGWAYKAFSVLHYNVFDQWTFIDGDYLPLCNLETELRPLVEKGLFVSTEDGVNSWTDTHEEAIGVKPGTYMNINAGFISMDMNKHDYVVHEWRNLMTRRKPFDLWYGDQGALNAVLDKWQVNKHTLDKVLWNQTWLNEHMAKEDLCRRKETEDGPVMWYEPKAARIMGWHGMAGNKLWHQLGIDHYRKNNPEERQRFYQECQLKSPSTIVDIFGYFLFLDRFNRPLRRNQHLLIPP